jgi:hypothetical protein
MYIQVGPKAASGTPRTTTGGYIRSAWSRDAVTERDRRDLEESLKAQAERFYRSSDVRRD